MTQKTGVVVQFRPTAKHPIRPPFAPATGNPEAEQYDAWFLQCGGEPLDTSRIPRSLAPL